MRTHSLLFIFSTLFVGAFPASRPYNPTDLISLSAGESSARESDIGSKYMPLDWKTSSRTAQPLVDEPTVSDIYKTARIFLSKFTYRFPVTPGQKFLRLYFNPVEYPDFDARDSFFSVTAHSFPLMKNFSAYLTVSAAHRNRHDMTLMKEFIIPVRESQTLDLTFTPSPKSKAFVNGVEIVSMPDGLYSLQRLQKDHYSSLMDFENSTTALENVYRINVGGEKVDSKDDTGMFRRWDSDMELDVFNETRAFLALPPGPQSRWPPVRYTRETPRFTAPEFVYLTGRGMTSKTSQDLKFNLTWFFPVDGGFYYFMRLHFCMMNPYPRITGPGQFLFTIYINNQTATQRADVISGYMIPAYKDFVTYVQGKGRTTLWLALHPCQDERDGCGDAILNGVELFKINNSAGALAGFNPEGALPVPPQRNEKPSKTPGISPGVVILVSTVLGGVFLVASLVAVALWRKKKFKEEAASKHKSSLDPVSWVAMSVKSTGTNASSLPSDLCRRFSIAEIRLATSDFDESTVIGRGGFGHVYKGLIDDGITTAAIKRLDPSSVQGAHEFETEVEMLSKLRHRHLVSLIGYCDDEGEMILVYEYMSRGTLRSHLYQSENPALPWKKRLEVCIGAARGLHYLHTGAKYPIIHRDVKSTNILLDDKFVAKVSDFGLSRIGPTSTSHTHVSTGVKGSVGYLDPEYYRRQHVTQKSDVYSFGVVLFEVLCARPAMVQGLQKEQVSLAQWAKVCYSRRNLHQLVDPQLENDISPVSLEKFCEIAHRCIHDRGSERPTMNDVVWGLEFALQLQQVASVGGKMSTEGGDSSIVSMEGLRVPITSSGTTEDESSDLFSGHEGTCAGSTSSASAEKSLIKHDGQVDLRSEVVFSELGTPKGR